MVMHLVAVVGVMGLGAIGDVELLHDFRDTGLWRLNADGGQGVSAKPGDAGGMQVVFTDAPPHWGNLVGPSRAPSEATALRVTLTKHTGAPPAAMHIWLLEPDGDAWVQQVRWEGRSVGEWQAGRKAVTLPAAGFSFEPRGKGTRQMASCDRMLIGCNYADLAVTMERMEWIMANKGISETPVSEVAPPIEAGRMGSVGILQMDGRMPGNWKPTHAPDAVARVLRSSGFGVTILRPAHLRNRSVLDPKRLSAVVLPCGPFFPADCREAFLSYLKAGGSFVSTDGYAFDRLVQRTDSGWADLASTVTVEDTANPAVSDALWMNTRHGRSGDAMNFRPDQIGAFDPAYMLTDCVSARASEWYGAVAGADALDYRWPKAVRGFAACALTGDNNPVFPPTYRRWIPILDGKDARNRDRGPVLGLARNHAGAFKGSSWAFAGLTGGDDLFLKSAARRRLLADLVSRVVDGVFLHSLQSDYACYRTGETATVQVTVACHGSKPFVGRVVLRAGRRALLSQVVRLEAGSEVVVSANAKVEPSGTGFVPVVVDLTRGDALVDRLDGGYCVATKAVLERGPKIGWSGNYFTLNGRSQVLLGSNQTGMMFFATGEGPAMWERDFAQMARGGMRVLRILHFSPFAARGYEGVSPHQSADLAQRPERLCRQMDAIVQTAQRHGVVIFLTQHDWLPVGLTDADLEHQRRWNRFWAARYRDVPGIIYDVQNEPSVDVPERPDIAALWNVWLASRYTSDAALREAWHVSPPEAALPNVPLKGGTGQWNDVRTADRKRGEEFLLNRWVAANVAGIKDGDPDALVCVGYLPSMSPADKVLGVRHTDFSNMHYYGPTDGLPLELALIDRRAYGKGMTVGEFGAMEAHARRNAGADGLPALESIERFSHTVHAAVGMGAAMLCNWSLKEFDQMVFPWGLYHHGTPVAKPWTERYEAMARSLRRFEPVYVAPQVYVVIPDGHRIGPRFEDIHAAIRRCAGMLLDLNVPFGMLNESDLEVVPPSAKALFWPIPYCPLDGAFGAVTDWVRRGGVLYVSGSVAFDTARRATRTDRMADLGLSSDLKDPFEDGRIGGLHFSAVGKGRVVYAPGPREMQDRPDTVAAYAEVLKAAAVAPIALRVSSGKVRVQRLQARSGDALYVFERMDAETKPVRVTVPDASVSLTLQRRECAFVLVGPSGKAKRL
ncbi:MAG: hypothetical protein FJX72_01230 [Armatimonadetes bacterium]|nr:hypothetical protein [Armatimonadota bacterium]